MPFIYIDTNRKFNVLSAIRCRSKSDENVLCNNGNGPESSLRVRCTLESNENAFASLPHQKKTERLMTSSMINSSNIKSTEDLNNSVNVSTDNLTENRGRHSFLFGRSLFHRSSRKSTWVIKLLLHSLSGNSWYMLEPFNL